MFGPLGPRRDDYLAAIVAMTVRNSQVQKKSQLKAFDDFLINWNPPLPLDEEGVIVNGEHP